MQQLVKREEEEEGEERKRWGKNLWAAQKGRGRRLTRTQSIYGVLAENGAIVRAL